MKYLIGIILICLSSNICWTQDDDSLDELINKINQRNEKIKSSSVKEIGINLTQLITQFVPFNESVRKAGPFGVIFRKGRGNKRFNFQLGVNFDDVVDSNNQFNMAVGLLKRKELSQKFSYYISYNGILNFGSFNIPNDTFRDATTIGFGLGLGFEYNISEIVMLSTETMIVLGISDDSGLLTTIPPIGLNLFVKINQD